MWRNPKSDMSAPLKVLFLLEDLCFGGTQTQNTELAIRLNREFFEPSILTLTGPTDLDSKIEAAKIPLYHIGNSRPVPPLFFTTLGRHIEKIRPDIMVPCTAIPNIWGRIWGRVKKVPAIIGTCRGGGAPRRQHERFLWRLAHGVICNSPELTRKMHKIGVPPERLAYIPNGVDTERFKPVAKNFSTDEPLIVCVARLAADKDHKTLINAFAKLAETIPKARLRLVGEGPEERALKIYVEKNLSDSLRNQVEFAGSSADPAAHYAEADICALSSIRESLPNAILEAMSSCRPVCATATGAIPSLLDGCGLISYPGDAEGMANNFLALLRSPRMATHLAVQGRVKSENEFSYSAMISSHEEFFKKIYHLKKEKK